MSVANQARSDQQPESQRSSLGATQITELCELLSEVCGVKVGLDLRSAGLGIAFQLGAPDVFGTTSYWILQYHAALADNDAPSFSLGANLREETACCLLGGYGVRAEVAIAAFRLLKSRGLLDSVVTPSEQAIESLLSLPLKVGESQVRYRFPRQRAKRIAAALRFLSTEGSPPSDPRCLRDWLLQIPGVGLKTASWIVRNLTGSSDVAIIDVHLERAGRLARWFRSDWRLPCDYLRMEESFLAVCDDCGLEASLVDTIIWDQMRTLGKHHLPR